MKALSVVTTALVAMIVGQLVSSTQAEACMSLPRKVQLPGDLRNVDLELSADGFSSDGTHVSYDPDKGWTLAGKRISEKTPIAISDRNGNKVGKIVLLNGMAELQVNFGADGHVDYRKVGSFEFSQGEFVSSMKFTYYRHVFTSSNCPAGGFCPTIHDPAPGPRKIQSVTMIRDSRLKGFSEPNDEPIVIGDSESKPDQTIGCSNAEVRPLGASTRPGLDLIRKGLVSSPAEQSSEGGVVGTAE